MYKKTKAARKDAHVRTLGADNVSLCLRAGREGGEGGGGGGGGPEVTDRSQTPIRMTSG